MRYNQYAKPSECRLDTGQLLAMIDELEERLELHNLSIRYENATILEGTWAPFSLEVPQMMHSLSKIGVSLCVGIAIDEGKLKLHDRAITYLSEDIPAQYDSALELITIKDLLTMQAGSTKCCNNVWFTNLEKDWEREWLKEPKIREDIGCVFHYDSGCSYTLSRIITKVMGKNCLALLKERVFSKMGLSDVNWLVSPEGHNTGGWGMYLTATQITTIGQLLVQKGEWEGEQLVPAWWIEEIGKPRVSIPNTSDSELKSYGYHLKAGSEIYAAEGAFGQYLIVFRNYPITIGITSGSSEYLAADICQKYIKAAHDTFDDGKDYDLEEVLLACKLKELSIYAPLGCSTPRNKKTLALLDRRFALSDNPRAIKEATFKLENDQLAVTYRDEDGVQRKVMAGFKKWEINRVYPGDFTKEFIGMAFSFSEDALHLKVSLINSSYVEYYTFYQSENKLRGEWRPNVTYLEGNEENIWGFHGQPDKYSEF